MEHYSGGRSGASQIQHTCQVPLRSLFSNEYRVINHVNSTKLQWLPFGKVLENISSSNRLLNCYILFTTRTDVHPYDAVLGFCGSHVCWLSPKRASELKPLYEYEFELTIHIFGIKF